MLPAYTVEVGTEPLVRPARNSVGGWPFLDQAQDWPECFCGEQMALFFQFDIPWDLEPFGGDHLLVFHCRAHNDASDPQFADGRTSYRGTGTLRSRPTRLRSGVY